MKDELGALSAFAAVAEARSFTRAAGSLGTSQSALSHAVRRLEARLGVRLLTRTTRSVALTDAGLRLLETVGPALLEIEAGLDRLTESRDGPAGTVRISSADHAAETLVWPKLKPLLFAHPNIIIEMVTQNRLIDIVAERFDAGVRLGDNLAKDMIAVPIGPRERQVIVGSPAYLSGRAQPRTPQDLADHSCINRRMETLGGFSAWEFARDGVPSRIRVAGRVAFNRPELILDAALSGLGLAALLESQAIEHIRAGRLMSVLADWCPSFPGYHLYYPSRRQHAPAFSLVADALRFRAA